MTAIVHFGIKRPMDLRIGPGLGWVNFAVVFCGLFISDCVFCFLNVAFTLLAIQLWSNQ
jgi:hypothetical protein